MVTPAGDDHLVHASLEVGEPDHIHPAPVGILEKGVRQKPRRARFENRHVHHGRPIGDRGSLRVTACAPVVVVILRRRRGGGQTSPE